MQTVNLHLKPSTFLSTSLEFYFFPVSDRSWRREPAAKRSDLYNINIPTVDPKQKPRARTRNPRTCICTHFSLLIVQQGNISMQQLSPRFLLPFVQRVVCTRYADLSFFMCGILFVSVVTSGMATALPVALALRYHRRMSVPGMVCTRGVQ